MRNDTSWSTQPFCSVLHAPRPVHTSMRVRHALHGERHRSGYPPTARSTSPHRRIAASPHRRIAASPHRRIAASYAVGNLTGLHPPARCGAPDTFTHALFSSALRGVRTNCHTQDLTIQRASASGFNNLQPARAKRERVMPPGRVRLVAKPHTNVNINEIVNRTNSKYE
ncbi:hypothetical protein [Burkholderia cepacia]|uniref:hypothetical protein n=1 Tax=Burkholderia cepacia TaxID=292 RepID=UPI0012D9F047|nr:hypothetical protein [Burkholderia cepacia]